MRPDADYWVGFWLGRVLATRPVETEQGAEVDEALSSEELEEEET